MGKRTPLVVVMLVFSVPMLFIYGSKWQIRKSVKCCNPDLIVSVTVSVSFKVLVRATFGGYISPMYDTNNDFFHVIQTCNLSSMIHKM